MKKVLSLVVLPIILLLSACSSNQAMIRDWPIGEPATDDQGAVSVSVTPVDGNPNELNFEVSLDTHSVDLNMDLAQLAVLQTDTGISVAAFAWQSPMGGHHSSGLLTFPAEVNGSAILSGASQITLVITGVDAPERNFVWDLE
jgi:hypothetical protein